MALIDGLGGSKRWNRWLSVVDRVALSAWNTHTLIAIRLRNVVTEKRKLPTSSFFLILDT